MKRTLLWTLSFLGALAVFAEGNPDNWESWELDKQHNSVSFDIGHLGISKIRGFMMLENGSLKTDPNDVLKTEIEVKIDVNSLNTGVPMRDNHVKSDDFLSAEKFPYISFKSTGVREDKAKGKLYIDGDLTIKGKTKKVTLETNPISEEIRMPKEGNVKVVRATAATTTINRYDFGIDYGKVNDKQNLLSKIVDGGVGQQIAITIFTEFFKIVPSSSASKNVKH